MEFPDLGKHCSMSTCNKLDFLPIKCDACNQIFCNEHFQYSVHNCFNAYAKSNQVPVCPLCNIPIPITRGQPPDIAVGAHIDSDCQSDPAKDNRKKVFTNKCSLKGCKTKEVVPIVCNECSQNYCLKHRHVSDHNCEGAAATQRKRALQAVYARQNQSRVDVQGNMSEDEALARAIQMSMQDTATKRLTTEELDFALARQLAQEVEATGSGNRNSIRDRCNIS